MSFHTLEVLYISLFGAEKKSNFPLSVLLYVLHFDFATKVSKY